MSASLSAFDILSFLISCFLPFSGNSDIKHYNFPIFVRCKYFLPSALTRFRYGYQFISWCINVFLGPLFWFISLNVAPSASMILCLLLFPPTGLGFLPCISWKILYTSVWVVAFASYQTSLHIHLFLTWNRIQIIPGHQFPIPALLPTFLILPCTTTLVCTLPPVVSFSLVGLNYQNHQSLFLGVHPFCIAQF